MLPELHIQFYQQVRGKLYLSFLPIIYYKHYWMMSVKRPHEEVTMGHLENNTKFEVNDNTSVTPNVIGNMTTPSEKIQ